MAELEDKGAEVVPQKLQIEAGRHYASKVLSNSCFMRWWDCVHSGLLHQLVPSDYIHSKHSNLPIPKS